MRDLLTWLELAALWAPVIVFPRNHSISFLQFRQRGTCFHGLTVFCSLPQCLHLVTTTISPPHRPSDKQKSEVVKSARDHRAANPADEDFGVDRLAALFLVVSVSAAWRE